MAYKYRTLYVQAEDEHLYVLAAKIAKAERESLSRWIAKLIAERIGVLRKRQKERQAK
jgi:hypothetical protein